MTNEISKLGRWIQDGINSGSEFRAIPIPKANFSVTVERTFIPPARAIGQEVFSLMDAGGAVIMLSLRFTYAAKLGLFASFTIPGLRYKLNVAQRSCFARLDPWAPNRVFMVPKQRP